LDLTNAHKHHVIYQDAFILHHVMLAGGLLHQPVTAYPHSVSVMYPSKTVEDFLDDVGSLPT